MIAARAWAQASEDSPQPASKQHHRYTTMLVAHDTVGLRQRCHFPDAASSPAQHRPVRPTCTRLSPTPYPNRSGVFDGRERNIRRAPHRGTPHRGEDAARAARPGLVVSFRS